MSSRNKIFSFNSHRYDPDCDFIPFVQERDNQGRLLRTKDQLPQNKSYIKQPILENPEQSLKMSSISQAKCNQSPLEYLIMKRSQAKLTPHQEVTLQNLLLQDETFNYDRDNHENVSFVTAIQISKAELYSQIKSKQDLKSMLAQQQLSNFSQEKNLKIKLNSRILSLTPTLDDQVSQKVEQISRVPTNLRFNSQTGEYNNNLSRQPKSSIRRFPRLNLVSSRNVYDKKIDFIDYSMDQVKPKSVFNIIFKRPNRINGSQPKVPIVLNKTRKDSPRKARQDENENMYGKMISEINLQVSREQQKNFNQLLNPQGEFNFREMTESFAIENYSKMKKQMKQVQEYRGNLRQISKKMEEIISLRRYGGVRDKEEDVLILEGKVGFL